MILGRMLSLWLWFWWMRLVTAGCATTTGLLEEINMISGDSTYDIPIVERLLSSSTLPSAYSTTPRLFPAAQVEVYTKSTGSGGTTTDSRSFQGKPELIGLIHPHSNTSFRIITFVAGEKVSYSSATGSNYVNSTYFLTKAIERFRSNLNTKLPDFAEDYPNQNHDNDTISFEEISALQIHVQSSDPILRHGVDESYSISVNRPIQLENDETTEHDHYHYDDCNPYKYKDRFTLEDEQAPNAPPILLLRSNTIFGALHGLESLQQLMEFGWLANSTTGTLSEFSLSDWTTSDSKRLARSSTEPVYLIRSLPLLIADEPSYSYRGLLIDTSRHYLPLSLILENLDAMAMNKLNILHWHLTDSQSFPYQSKNFPELSAKGAYKPQMIYTPDNIRQVVQEAYLRGIRVIPEIDLPGHSNAIGKSHPEWMSTCPDTSEPLDPTKQEVYDFISTLYREISTIDDTEEPPQTIPLFPDEFIHVGGDEVILDCWNNSIPIRKWMDENNITDPVKLYNYFEERLLRILEKETKPPRAPIVWQEVFHYNLTIPNTTIIDVWKHWDQITTRQAIHANYRVIVSGCWYLDYLNRDWTWFYHCRPRVDANVTRPSDDLSLLLGGHASMWGERVDASNFMSRVWPRTSAVAERLWTGNNGTIENATGVIEQTVEYRLAAFRCRMVQQGYNAGPIGPGVCPHEVPYLSA